MVNESITKYEHVYYHTDSDLLFKPGLYSHILQHSFGVGLLGRLGYASTEWYHSKRMREDNRLNSFVDRVLGGRYDELRIGRIEGTYAKYSIWSLAMEAISEYFDNDFFEVSTNHWCAEEVLIPTMFFFYKQQIGEYWKTDTNAINAKHAGSTREERILDIQDIEQFCVNPSIYGAKWFASEHDDAVLYCMSPHGKS